MFKQLLKTHHQKRFDISLIVVGLMLIVYMSMNIYAQVFGSDENSIAPEQSKVVLADDHVVNDTKYQTNVVKTAWGEYELSKKDIECLTLNAYHEARGEGEKGIIAVAMVTVNRAASKHMGSKTVCQAVMKPKQFSWTNKEYLVSLWTKATRPAEYKIVKNAIEKYISGTRLVKLEKALYYHETSIKPKWSHADNKVAMIGNHKFYDQAYVQRVKRYHA